MALTFTQQLFEYLHSGGEFAHLWTDNGFQSHWFQVSRNSRRNHPTAPNHWRNDNIYFTVNPLSQIPPTNASGNTNPRYIGSQLEYITATNTLFAEYDGKDLVRLPEYAKNLPTNFTRLELVEQRTEVLAAKETVFYTDPKKFKQRALDLILSRYYPPSVIVDSGGGYHCYWLLRETVPVDETNIAELQAIQHGWVQMMKADQGASDLRRMLRVPGTYNMKPGFGAAHPKVGFIKANFGLRYDYNALQEAVNDWLFEHRPTPSKPSRKSQDFNPELADFRANFNQQHSIADILTKHGYSITFLNESIVRLARPGRNKSQSSVTVFPSRHATARAPEYSIHFSTNDQLYSEEYVDETTGRVRRRTHDAYAVYVALEHDGNWRAAYASLKERMLH